MVLIEFGFSTFLNDTNFLFSGIKEVLVINLQQMMNESLFLVLSKSCALFIMNLNFQRMHFGITVWVYLVQFVKIHVIMRFKEHEFT